MTLKAQKALAIRRQSNLFLADEGAASSLTFQAPGGVSVVIVGALAWFVACVVMLTLGGWFTIAGMFGRVALGTGFIINVRMNDQQHYTVRHSTNPPEGFI